MVAQALRGHNRYYQFQQLTRQFSWAIVIFSKILFNAPNENVYGIAAGIMHIRGVIELGVYYLKK